MRVLLINSNSKADLLAAPPIGLSYIATATQAAGHEVRVVDLCFSPNRDLAVRRSVSSFSPDVIGISVRNVDNVNMLHPVSFVRGAAEIVAEIRKISNATIVVGGAGASLIPREVLSELRGDYIVVTAGERSFPQLLAALEQGSPCDRIPGVGFFRNGNFHLTPPVFEGFTIQNPNLGNWIDMKPYQKVGTSYLVQTKRGCSHRCIYCTYNSALEGQAMRLRPPAEVVDEIEEAIDKYKPDSFEFVDSVFNEPQAHCTAILEEVVRRPWKAHFTAMGVNPVNLDSEMLDLMWRAGFRSFMMTPESASPTMIKSYRKGFAIDDLVRAAVALEKTRFTVLWYFLIGGPGETNETLQETLRFTEKYLVRKERPPYHMANFYLGVRIYPNTRLWEMAVEDKFIAESSDPLGQLWYLSDSLDLERAVRDMTRAANRFPEICMGFDERYLMISKLVAFLGDLFKMPKPYWRHYWGANNLLVKTRLRSLLQPRNIVQGIRARLAEQRHGISGT